MPDPIPETPDDRSTADGAPAARCYLVCATPRSGSYLLCERLKETGIAGRPTEYFSGGFQQYWSPRWGTADYDAYLRRVRRQGTTSNGVFGAKVHASQFDYFSQQASGRSPVPYAARPALLDRWFPDVRYVRLRRRDRLRQAVSYVKAIQSNVWWDADRPPAPYDPPRAGALRFDFAVIERSMLRMEEEDQIWTRYFDAIGIEPLTFDFEDIVIDPDKVLRGILDYLDLELPETFAPTPPTFRRQGDDQSEQWVARFEELRGRATSTESTWNVRKDASPSVERVLEWIPPVRSEGVSGDGTMQPAGRLSPLVRRGYRGKSPVDPGGDLRSVLGTPQWWWSSRPFAYARAWPVFTPDFYQELVTAFREFDAAGLLQRGIPGYDVTAMSLTPSNAGPFSVFLSAPWHDMLARMFDVDATREVNVSLHHHAPGSHSGTPHHDMNPGWFVRDRTDDAIVVHDPAHCDYRTGKTPDGSPSVERIRAVAVIYHFANPEGPTVGGETGLYTSLTDAVHRPAVKVPPHNNSLVAFECTAYSFHGFMTNVNRERNSLVMWLHRSKEDAVEQFGEASIVGW